MTKAQNYQIKWALELNDLELLPDPPPAHPEVGGRARQAAKTIKAALGG